MVEKAPANPAPQRGRPKRSPRDQRVRPHPAGAGRVAPPPRRLHRPGAGCPALPAAQPRRCASDVAGQGIECYKLKNRDNRLLTEEVAMAQGRKARAKQKRALPQHLHQQPVEGQLPAPAKMAGAPQTRRAFLSQLAGAAAAMAVADGVRRTGPGGAQSGSEAARWDVCPAQRESLRTRRNAAFQMRVDRARHWHDLPLQLPLANDDELLYPDGWANFSKALPHDAWAIPIRKPSQPWCTPARRGTRTTLPPSRWAGCSRSATLRQGCRSRSVGTTRIRPLSRPPRHSPAPGGRGDGRGLLGRIAARRAVYRVRDASPGRAGLPRPLGPERFSGPEGRRPGHAAHDLPRPIHGRWRRPIHLAIPAQGHCLRGAAQHAAGAGVRAGGGLPDHLRRLAGAAERRAVGRPPLRRARSATCATAATWRRGWTPTRRCRRPTTRCRSCCRWGRRSIRPIPT